MRIWIGLAFAAALATAQAEEWPPALPAGGVEVVAPGFTFHSPGEPWRVERDVYGWTQQRSASSLGIDILLFIEDPKHPEPLAAGSAATITVKPYFLTGSDRSNTVTDGFFASADGRENLKVNGASCVRRRVVEDTIGDRRIFTTTYLEQVCFHPAFPGFAVRAGFSETHPAGEKPFAAESDGLTVLNSIRFTSSPDFRIQEIMLDGAPFSLTEAEDAVWVGYQALDSNHKVTSNGSVARVDPKTNMITATIPVGRIPVKMVMAPSGLWVLSYLDGTATRIDPKTRTVLATIRVPDRPTGIAEGGGFIWVVSQAWIASPPSGKVVRIDPETGAVSEVPGAPPDAGSIAFLDGRLFISRQEGRFGIWQFDPVSGKPAKQILQCCSVFGVRDEHTLWLWEFGLQRFDLGQKNSKPVAFPKLPNPGSHVVPCGANYCFATPRGEIIEFDAAAPDARPVVKSIVAPASLLRNGLISAYRSLWVIPEYSNSVLRLDPKQTTPPLAGP